LEVDGLWGNVELMSQVRNPEEMRILYWGTKSSFSVAPLRQLLAAGFKVVAIFVPGSHGDRGPVPVEARNPISTLALPVLNHGDTENIVSVGLEQNIPIFRVRQLAHAETVRLVAELAPDVGCVACFPYRIPGALLEAPRAGFLNVHPSLLPAYRGPAPLFWALRNGERETGVTVHLMDERFDTGDIVLQAPVALADGISGVELEASCAALGGRLLVEALQALARGALPRQPQPVGGHYDSWPRAAHFRLDLNWPARRAFNFMRGTAEWRQPYTVRVAGERFSLQGALAFASRERLGQPYFRSGRSIRIQFTPGVLEALLTDP
jgi:methionyl-tRNA formyltransferase